MSKLHGKTLERELFFCALCGLWTPLNLSKNSLILYRIFATLLMSNYTLHMSLQTVYLIKCNDMSKFLASIIFYLTEISVGLKFYLSLTRRERFVQLLQRLSSNKFCIRTSEEQKIKDGHDRFSKLWFHSLACMGYLTTSLMCALPATNYLLSNEEDYSTTSMTDYLPLKIWSPIEITRSNILYFYIYLCPPTILGAVQFTSFDSLFFGFLEELCAQFDILAHRMKTLPPDQDLRKIRRELKKNIRHHEDLYVFASDLNDIVRPIVVTQFCLTSFIIATTLIQIIGFNIDKIRMTDFFNYVGYLGAVVMEFFLLCFRSNRLTEKSEEFYDKLYYLDLDILLKNKSFYVPMTERARKPIIMDGGPLINLTLESFGKVIKFSYSVLNMIKSKF